MSTMNSPAPGTRQTGTKAIVSAVIAFIGVFIVSLWQALQDKTNLNTMSASQWVLVVLGALATAIVTYGATYQIPNQPKP